MGLGWVGVGMGGTGDAFKAGSLDHISSKTLVNSSLTFLFPADAYLVGGTKNAFSKLILRHCQKPMNK